MKNTWAVLKLAKPMHALMAIIIVLMLISSAFEIVTPLLSGKILDEVVKQSGAEAKQYSVLVELLTISLISTLIYLITRSIGQRLGDLLSARMRKYLTETFYDKALSLPQSYYDGEVSGKVVNQLNRGLASIQQFMNTATNFILPTFLQAVIVIGILGYFNIYLALLMIVVFPIYYAISHISTTRWGKKETQKNVIEDRTRGRMQEVISNIKLVKGFTTEESEYQQVEENFTEINKIYSKQSNEFHLFDFARELSLYIILFITSIIIFYNAFIGAITIGTVIVLIQMIDRARIPLFGMSFILSQIQATEAGAKEFIEILNLPSTEDFRHETSGNIVQKPKITFKDVSFAYDEQPVLHDISFSIKQGEVVALVGPSGAGKSTLANLMLKLYEPTQGQISLNDIEYSQMSHKAVRQNIALVFQENELFSSTIAENVCYGGTFNEDKVIEVLKEANAWDFVSKLSNGIQTEVGERGVKLSGGQRQRIQIARAMYKDAPILILDEATSSLDAKSEMEVSQAIERLTKGRLVIIIAHRFSTIQHASKVIVLNDQKIEAMGSPQELSTQPGIYADLLKYQIEGNKKLLKKFELY